MVAIMLDLNHITRSMLSQTNFRSSNICQRIKGKIVGTVNHSN